MQQVECQVQCPHCGAGVKTYHISGNEEGVARCYLPCGQLFAIRWTSGKSVTAKIAWPDSAAGRQMKTGEEWESDSSLEKWFPITAGELVGVSESLKSYRLIPDDVWMGTNSTADKVQWLVNRCSGSDEFIKRNSAASRAFEWLAAGKYRKILRRHDGGYRFVNEALNIWADGDSLESIVYSEFWPKFRDCTERAP